MLAAAMIELTDEKRTFGVTDVGELAQPLDGGPVVDHKGARPICLLRRDAQRFRDDAADASLCQRPVELHETLAGTIAIGQVRRCRDSHDAILGFARPKRDRLEQVREGAPHHCRFLTI